MKRWNIILWVFLFYSAISNAQPGLVLLIVDKMPVFPGCDEKYESNAARMGCSEEKLINYIKDNIRYSRAMMEDNVQGNTEVQFVVEEDGSITDVQLLKGLHFELDREIIRVVSEALKWKPGLHKGKPVRVLLKVPLSFRIISPDDEVHIRFLEDMVCESFKKYRIRERDLINLGRAMPRNKGLCDDQRLLRKLEMTFYKDKFAKAKIAKSRRKLIITQKMVKFLKSATKESHFILKMTIRVSNQIVEVVHVLEIE